jgi:hypothetical protein
MVAQIEDGGEDGLSTLLDKPALKAIKWVNDHREYFSLRHASSQEERIRLFKPLGELALAAWVARGVTIRTEGDWSKEILDLCWTEFNNGDDLFHLIVARPDLIVLSTIYATFRVSGYSNYRLDSYLRYLANTANSGAIEFPAWRRLDVAYGFASLGLAPFPEDASSRIWAAWSPEPWMITEDSAYALTHSVFYITDFGAKPLWLVDDVSAYIRAWLPSWMAIFNPSAHSDLFAELLMVAACIGVPSLRGCMELVRRQDALGNLPGPAGSAASFRVSSMAPERADFLKTYHTTLVFIMALAMHGALSRPSPACCAIGITDSA